MLYKASYLFVIGSLGSKNIPKGYSSGVGYVDTENLS